MRTTSMGRRYARAAFEVARDAGDPQGWLDQLLAVSEALSDGEIREGFRSPNLPDSEKTRVIRDSFVDLAPQLLNLIRLLIERRRLELLPAITDAFSGYVDEMLGRTEAEVTTARPLEADELRSIEERLNRRTGQTVKLRPTVDPALIGGFILRLGDDLVDASVATRLQRLRQRLA